MQLTDERVSEITVRFQALFTGPHLTLFDWRPKNIDGIKYFIKNLASELNISEEELVTYFMHIGLSYEQELGKHFIIRPMEMPEISRIINSIADASPNGLMTFFSKLEEMIGLIEDHARKTDANIHDIASAVAGFVCLVSDVLSLVHAHG